MTEYSNLYEMLKAIRDYELPSDECIIPTTSYRGTHVGFCTADGAAQSVYWTIPVQSLKTYEKGSEVEQALYERLRFYHTRKDLLSDLRAGKVNLTPPVTPTPESIPEVSIQEVPEEPVEEESLQAFKDLFDL